MNRPDFTPGKNMAMKVPSHEYEETVAFYGDVLGLQQISGDVECPTDSVRFRFGVKVLWIDNVPSLSQTEIWLEIVTDDVELCVDYLERHGCNRRDQIEALPVDFSGF